MQKTDEVQNIKVNNQPVELKDWLKHIIDTDCRYEIAVHAGDITFIVVDEPHDGGDFSDLEFGRVVGTKTNAYKQKIYKPALVNGVFVKNYDVKKRTQDR
jgi:hypothetical protein